MRSKDIGLRDVFMRGLLTVLLGCGVGATGEIPVASAQDLALPVEEVGQTIGDGMDTFLILQTNLQPPYQELQDGMLSGYSIAVLNCAFDRIGIGYGLAVAPRQRNREMVRSGRADGFFLARLSPFMDEYAVPSYPLALEKWVWISKRFSEKDPRSGLQTKPVNMSAVGAILGSNEAEWLLEEGYADINRAPSFSSLVSQVMAGHVEYALVDKQSFEAARNELGLGSENFELRFERYAPLVVYFSKVYLQKFPNMLNDLNDNLEFCETVPMNLEPWERAAIERDQLPSIEKLAGASELITKIRTELDGATYDTETRKLLDVEWIAKVRNGDISLAASNILENDLSQYLRKFQQASSGHVAEAFVFNLRGEVIGMNRVTSDFDQSDETKFQMTDNLNRGHAQIDDILFDGSTRSFLSQITVPVIDPDTGNVMAALTVGLDVSAALRPES
jgi:hypothetical protein